MTTLVHDQSRQPPHVDLAVVVSLDGQDVLPLLERGYRPGGHPIGFPAHDRLSRQPLRSTRSSWSNQSQTSELCEATIHWACRSSQINSRVSINWETIET